METSIKGVVETCIFKNEQSGFGIYRIALLNSNQKPLTIKGPLINIELESYYEFQGSYHEDPRFGMQFNVVSFTKMLPEHPDFIVRFLSRPNFPGIGNKTATAIVEKYGNDVLDRIRQEDDFVIDVKGLSAVKAQKIIDVIRTQDPLEDAVSFLVAHGLGNKQIIKITKEYGEKAIEVIKDNPYRLVYDIDGIGFKTADKVALSLGFDLDDPLRVEAQILDTYKSTVFGAGDSYIPINTFKNMFGNQDSELFDIAYESLIRQRELIEDEDRLYHCTQYDAESYVANFLTDFEYRGYDFDLENFEIGRAHV